MNNQPIQQPQVHETYRAIKLLGEGSFGKAYLVEGNTTHEKYVIKTINMESMKENEKKETLKEAEILRKMDHPNIIRFKDVFIGKKPHTCLNIVTEYADGGDLGEKIKNQPKNKPFPENQILDWFTQICLALKHIHNKHIIHRDLKSQNIFLTKSGLVKLGDFGIAKCLQNTWQQARTMVGTPYYLSPEIVKGNPYSFKSDIWSLGVMLYEMMALKMPFDANNLPMLSLKIMKGQYNPVSSIYTPDLRSLVSSLLSVDCNKRPTVNEILKLPLIKNRIKNFLTEIQYNKEFSKTIVKKYKLEKKKVIEKKPSISSQNSQETAPTNNNSNVNFHFKEKNNNGGSSQSNKNVVPSNIDHNILIKRNNSGVNENKQIPSYNIKNNLYSNINNAKKAENERKQIADFLNNKKESNNTSSKNMHSNSNKNLELQKIISKGRENLKKQGKGEDIIWSNDNKHKNSNLIPESNLPKNNFPKIIFVDKNTKNNLEEEQYNQNRYLNNLDKIVNEDKEDSDNQSIDEEDSKDNSKVSPSPKNQNQEPSSYEREQPDLSTVEKESPKTPNTDNLVSDYSEMEEMKIDLEKFLGIDLFKNLYHYVDSTTDQKEFKFNNDDLIQKIQNELSKQYSAEDIEKALSKCQEVFALVVKERMANLTN